MAFSQEKKDSSKKVIQRSVVKDSVIFPVDTLLYKIKTYSAGKRFLRKLLAPMIIVKEKKPVAEKPVAPTKPPEKPKEDFCPDSTKVIGSIIIKVFEPFGPRLNDMDRKTVNWVERRGNDLHHTTRQWVIKQRLLFKQGDRYDKFKITESERLIRQTGYVNDARIYIINYNYECDSYDVLIYVFDLFSLGVGASGDLNLNGDVTVNENNFIGTGHKLVTKTRYTRRNQPYPWQLGLDYNIPQIGKSFVSGNIYGETDLNNQLFGFALNRPMITYSIIYGGGLSMRWDKEFYSVQKKDSSYLTGMYYFQTTDAWIGRAFEPKRWEPLKLKGIVKQVSIGGRVINNHYVMKEIESNDIIQPNLFRENTLLLTSVSLNKRSYYKDQFIFGFGKTEDISLGHLYALIGGYELGSYYDRRYIGARYGFATKIQRIGYFSFGTEIGSFFKSNKQEEGAIGLNSLYFTDVMSIKKIKIRQFGWVRYSKGLNRAEYDYLYLNSGSALRGVNSGLAGKEKLTMNFETNLYFPYNILGFRVTGLLMMDYTLLKPYQSNLFKSPLYQGYGLGIRFKNEHLIFNAIQIAFYFYPLHDKLGVPFFRYHSTPSSYYRFMGFDNYQPSTVGYGF